MASLATGSAPTQASASQLITEAVGRFKQAASAQDQIEIQNTQVDDVIKALRVIQEGLQKKRQNRNLVKLYRFVQGLQKYTEAIEVLSNGLSPYLPWIWGPVKIVLQIASDHMVAFDKLIEAYDKIAETLPRLDQLSNAFKDNSTLLAKLALYYADVLEFHRRAYKFVRRRSWKFFFATTWANFDVRFDSILASLAHHSDLIVQEAHVFDIVEAKKWREKMDKQTAAMESEKLYRQRTSVIAWLGLDRPMQDDEGERLLRDCVPDSCDWILKNKTVESWLRPDNKDAVVWLHGKPGAGKSVICANLLESLQQQCFTTLSYFCKYRENISALAILKTFVLSLVNESPDLTAIAFANYVEKYAKISSKLLRTMLVGSPEKPGLLQGVPVCRIVVDGLDECELPEQKVIINALIQLISPGSCKLLICSRDVPEIRRALQRNSRRLATISLSNESALVNNTIHAFAKSKIEELMDDKPMLRDDSDMSDELIQIIVDKSDGMFLWAKLVLDLARDVDNLLELHDTLTTTPQELSKLYDQILGLLCKGQPEKRIERIMRTLAWITLAKRPLKPHEILHGVTVTPETPIVNKWNKLDDVVIDRCKPLIEELPNGSIALIHFTLQEYFSAKFEQSISSWHNSIAFSCATTINAGLLLVDPRYSEKDRLLHVVNGLLCLLPYSVDFWFDHLLDYATTNVDLIAEDSPLGKEVAGFYSSHHRIVRETGKQLPPAIRSQSPTADARVSKISHLPINALCLSLITFRKECGANLSGTGEERESYARQQDPTLLSDMLSQFRICIGSLLGITSMENVSDDQLRQFQAIYAPYVFQCRFTPCVGASLGFCSASLRDGHERLHIKRLFCDKLNCIRSKVGFRKQRELDQHNKTYHTVGSILVPPRVGKILEGPNLEDGGPLETKPSSLISNMPQAIKYGWEFAEISLRFHENLKRFDTMNEVHLGQGPSSRLSTPGMDYNSSEWAIIQNKGRASLMVKMNHTIKLAGAVSCVSFSRSDRYLAISCMEGIKVFDLEMLGRKRTFDHYKSTGDATKIYARAISISPNDKTFATGADDGIVRVWDLNFYGGGRFKPLELLPPSPVMAKIVPDGGLLKSFSGHEQEVNGIEYAPNGTYIASVSGDCTLRVWDTSVKEQHKRFVAARPLKCVSVSPDSLYIAGSYTDTGICVWDVKNKSMVYELADDIYRVSDVKYSPGGQHLVAASLDKFVRLWSATNQTPFHPQGKMELHEDSVLSIAITQDSQWVLSASTDKRLVMWNVATLEPHTVLLGHGCPIHIVAAARGQNMFATVTWDSVVRIWAYHFSESSKVV